MRLSVERLAFGYPGRRVGADVSFTVDGGEVLVLLGPNGAGKTTLFRTLLRLLPAHGGDVRVDEASIARWPRRRVAQTVGYVPQAQLGVFPFTVRDVVLMGRTPHVPAFAMPGAADRAIASRTLEGLGLAHLAERPYTEVSGGERQLTLVARALAQAPRILVMDEPTASLDFGNQVRVLGEVRALARRGIAVVLSTHDPDHAFLCADRVAMLHGGRLAHLGPPADTITPATLREVYGVDVEVHALPRAEGGVSRVCLPSLAADAWRTR
jgi:iron complex transport system ATP-binding protein